MKISKTILPLLLVFSAANLVFAEESENKESKSKKAAAADADREALFKHFKKTMSGVKLVGRFTILGRDDGPLPKEEYTITSVEKLPEGDHWLFKARVKYGQNDAPVALPLEVKWAGTTPIITLTDFTIPAMGTFSARVVIYNKKYAGTWTHGKVGGHLFGEIKKISDEKQDGKRDAE
jgi:hypothetical protein